MGLDNKIAPPEEIERVFEQHINEEEQQQGRKFSEQEKSISKANYLRNARLAVVENKYEDVLPMIDEFGLLFAHITNVDCSFIIGSHPMVHLPSDGFVSNLFGGIWLPISSDVAVSPGPQGSTEHIYNANEKDRVRHLNEAIFKQSSAIAGRSERLVRSLSKQK